MICINRRGLLALGACLAASASPARSAARIKLPTDKPNFILSMTDDSNNRMPRELFQNQKMRIAGKGARLRNCHVPFSQCERSRASFLLGQVYHNHLVRGYADMLAGKELSTIFTAMQAAGYFTIFVGKEMTDFGQELNARGMLNHVPPGIDYFAGKCEVTGPFRYYRPHYNVNGIVSEYKHGYMTYPDKPGYATDLEGDFALEGLSLAAASGKPVFMVVCWTACHGNGFGGIDDAPQPRDDLVGWMSGQGTGVFERDPVLYPHQPNWAVTPIGKPAWIQDAVPKTAEVINTIYQRQLECLATTPDGRGGTVDDRFGMILDFVDGAGWDSNTYVGCSDDNGYMLYELCHTGKIVGYRESTGVVFDIRGPKITPGIVVDAYTQTTDWVATVLDLAGVAPPCQQDGRSWKALFATGEAPPSWRTAVLVETERFGGFHAKGWTYIVTDQDGTPFYEVYDIARDPYQKYNRAYGSPYYDSRYDVIVPQLDAVHQRLSNGAGQSMWYAGDLPASPV